MASAGALVQDVATSVRARVAAKKAAITVTEVADRKAADALVKQALNAIESYIVRIVSRDAPEEVVVSTASESTRAATLAAELLRAPPNNFGVTQLNFSDGLPSRLIIRWDAQ